MNGLPYLKSCLASLYKNTDYSFNVIVVDNVSTDRSQEWLTEFAKKVNNCTVHFNKKPDSGFSEGNNIGLRYAKNKYVMLLNNDTLIIQQGWLWTLISELETDETVGLVGPKLLYPNDLIQHAGVNFGYQPETHHIAPFHLGRFARRDSKFFNVRREVPAVTGACQLTRRELLKDGLDETYKKGGYEDMDFCCKVRKLGYKIIYVPVELYHYEGATNLARNQKEWTSQLAENYKIWCQRWDQWIFSDMEKNTMLYEMNVPILAFY